MSDIEQARYRALGVLALDAPFDAALLAALWDVPLEQADDAADPLRLLGLVDVDGNAYRQHSALRAYARALLIREGELDTAFTRYATHMTTVAEQFRQLSFEQWPTLDAQLPHIHAVGDVLAAQVLDAEPTAERLALAGEFSWNTTRYLNYRPAALFTGEGVARTPSRIRWFEMGLVAWRATANQAREATTLTNIGLAWSALGEKRRALEFYELALPLRRAVGNRSGEATTLTNIGGAWSALGENRRALEFYEQALPLRRAVGDRSGEATTLTNIGAAWSALGEKRRALAFYEQALPTLRAVGDRSGEATTLNNIGSAWDALGEARRALEYLEQALPILRAVGNRRVEATTLNNIGSAWDALGESRRALEFYEQALPLYRAVGDRSGEAVTCYNIGLIYYEFGDLDKAIEYVERCVKLDEEIEHPDLESDRRTLEQFKAMRDGGTTSAEDQAARLMQQLAALYAQGGEAAVRQMLAGQVPDEVLDALIAQLAGNPAPSPSANTLPAETVQQLCQNTVAVMTVAQDQVGEWRTTLQGARTDMAGRGVAWQIEVAFADALLAVLAGQSPTLPSENPYHRALQQVVDAIQQHE